MESENAPVTSSSIVETVMAPITEDSLNNEDTTTVPGDETCVIQNGSDTVRPKPAQEEGATRNGEEVRIGIIRFIEATPLYRHAQRLRLPVLFQYPLTVSH